MAGTKTNTQNDTKTRTTSWRNRHLEKLYVVFFGFFIFLFFFIYNLLNEFSKKCWVTALVRSITFIGILNQFSAIANLTLTQHLLENVLSPAPGWKSFLRLNALKNLLINGLKTRKMTVNRAAEYNNVWIIF